MRDDLPAHLQRVLDLRPHADGATREVKDNASEEAASLVVLAPEDAVPFLDQYFDAETGDGSEPRGLDQTGSRRNRANGTPSVPAARDVCMTVGDLAGRLARTHPAGEDSTRISASTTARIVRDALDAMDPDTRAALAAPDDMEACVMQLCDHVRSLREHDVSPATLYAVSPGAGMTSELQALAIAYEAYDRYLLESPQHDLADLCGWATAQLRTGRATWLEAATVAVYDHIQLSGAAALFLRALRDYAGRFERIGAGATGPPASVSASVAAPDRLPDLASILDASSKEAPRSTSDTHAFVDETLSRYVAHESSASLSWIVASGGLRQALGDVRRMGWRDIDLEIATPALPQNEKGNGQAVPPNAVSFESAGFRARNLLIIDATHLGLRTPDHEASAGATLLSAKMREKIASLTGAVLPAHGGDTDADLWQIAQMLWRHGGEAIIVTKDQTGRLVDLLSKHLKPYVLSGREQNRSAKR